MDNSPESESVSAADRRDRRRKSTDLKIEVSVETGSLEGQTQNLSAAGVFFFSESDLRVRVSLEQEDGPIERSGRLVRVERMNEDSTGFAIEFDPA
jgi:hypothetical protein